VIDRHGKTIEQIKVFSSGSVQEMVFWNNNSPNIEALIPVEQIYTGVTKMGGHPLSRFVTLILVIKGVLTKIGVKEKLLFYFQIFRQL